MSSNGSDDLSRFLDDRRRLGPRIHTSRPINVRPSAAPPAPPETRRHRGSIATTSQVSDDSLVRVFTRQEVRGLRPARAINLDPNFTDQIAMRWRLRGFLNDTGSITSFRGKDADTEKFTLGSQYREETASVRTGATTELDRALDSRYVPTRRKRPKLPKTEISAEPPVEPPVEAPVELQDDAQDDAYNGGDSSAVEDRRPEPIPSRLSSSSVEDGQLFVQSEDYADREREHNDEHDGAQHNGIDGEHHESGDGNVIIPRPRDPHEPEEPLIFDVPVSEMPAIDWGVDDIDVDGEYLQQQLEHSESESEEESDIGSVAEMIDDDSDDDDTPYVDQENRGNEEYMPPPQPSHRQTIDLSSESESDGDGVEALTESEDDENIDEDVTLSRTAFEARQQRGKRHRIPTVQWWLGERIEYEPTGKHQLLTAVDVRRVEMPKRTYRRRRPYRRRTLQHVLPLDDMEADAGQEDVQVPVYDSASNEWKDRTVARSVNGLDFQPVVADDGVAVPLVSRCILFGGNHDMAPLRLCVMRIQPGGVFSYTSEQNKASTFVVWRGKCTVHMNNYEFDLTKGMACLLPRGNDFFLNNGGTAEEGLSAGDVYLFVTEVNAESNPELADALTRDAHSMVSGTAAFSKIFDSASEHSEHAADGPPDFVDMPEEVDESPADAAPADAAPASAPTGAPASPVARDARFQFRPNPPGGRKRAHQSETGSLDSFSMALRSERGLDLRRRRVLPVAPPTKLGGDTMEDNLSDYLEGRRGNPRRLILRERPVPNLEEFRIQGLLRQQSAADSEDRSL